MMEIRNRLLLSVKSKQIELNFFFSNDAIQNRLKSFCCCSREDVKIDNKVESRCFVEKSLSLTQNDTDKQPSRLIVVFHSN